YAGRIYGKYHGGLIVVVRIQQDVKEIGAVHLITVQGIDADAGRVRIVSPHRRVDVPVVIGDPYFGRLRRRQPANGFVRGQRQGGNGIPYRVIGIAIDDDPVTDPRKL